MFDRQKNDKYKAIAFYALAVIIISALFIVGMLHFSEILLKIKAFFGVLAPFTYGFIIAYLCNPILIFYEKRVFAFRKSKKDLFTLRRALSLILTVITAIAIISVLAYAVIPQTVNSINDLASQLNFYIQELQDLADDLTVKYAPILFNEDYTSFGEFLKDHEIAFSLKDIISNSFGFFQSGLDRVFSFGSRFVGEVLNILMGIIMAVYFLASKEKLCAQAKKLLASLTTRRAYLNTIRLARYTHKTFGGFIVGKIIDSAIIGVLSFVVLWILKMPYYPLLAVIIGVTNVVPTFGPIFGGIIGGLIVLIVAPESLLLFLILVLLIQQLDGNIIGPFILGDSIGISALWVVISIILASGLFGFAGMVIGVPAVAVIYALVKQSAERRLEKKNMPKSTEFYRNDPPMEEALEPEHILIGRETEIPEITSADDIPDSPCKKKITLTERFKAFIKRIIKKGNK